LLPGGPQRATPPPRAFSPFPPPPPPGKLVFDCDSLRWSTAVGETTTLAEVARVAPVQLRARSTPPHLESPAAVSDSIFLPLCARKKSGYLCRLSIAVRKNRAALVPAPVPVRESDVPESNRAAPLPVRTRDLTIRP
jgi:hypothetical protein